MVLFITGGGTREDEQVKAIDGAWCSVNASR